MTARQTRRLLLIAFAISLVIHAVIALRFDWPFTVPKDQIETVRIERLHTLRVSRIPSPPPATPPPVTPAPKPSSVATSPSRSAKKPAGKAGSGVPGEGSSAAPTPVPTAVAVATPNCAKTDTPVTLVTKPEQPDIAPAARGDATNGTTLVRVVLDANGVVQQAAVVESSGNSSLDLVAVSVARGAHYAPATHDCKAVAGQYDFKTKWVAW